MYWENIVRRLVCSARDSGQDIGGRMKPLTRTVKGSGEALLYPATLTVVGSRETDGRGKF